MRRRLPEAPRLREALFLRAARRSGPQIRVKTAAGRRPAAAAALAAGELARTAARAAGAVPDRMRALAAAARVVVQVAPRAGAPAGEPRALPANPKDKHAPP